MKQRLLFLAILLTLGSNGCKPTENETATEVSTTEATQTQTEKSPQETVKDFLDLYVIEREVGQAYNYFTAADKAVKSEAAYVKEKTQTAWEPALKKHGSYTIKSSEVKPDSATFIANLKTVDVEKLVKESMGDMTLLQLASMKEEDVSKLAEKNMAKYKDGNAQVPLTDMEQTINLVKENGEWKIDIGWAKEAEQSKTQNQTLQVGEEGVLMSDPDKGNVFLKVNSVKFNKTKAPEGSVFCIVNVTVSNKMDGQFTENFTTATASSAVFTSDGSKYKQEFFHPSQLNTKQLDNLNPLNPGKSTTGDLVFPVDKKAKALKLTFDAGHSPIPENFDYQQNRSLNFNLGDVAI